MVSAISQALSSAEIGRFRHGCYEICYEVFELGRSLGFSRVVMAQRADIGFWFPGAALTAFMIRRQRELPIASICVVFPFGSLRGAAQCQTRKMLALYEHRGELMPFPRTAVRALSGPLPNRRPQDSSRHRRNRDKRED